MSFGKVKNLWNRFWRSLWGRYGFRRGWSIQGLNLKGRRWMSVRGECARHTIWVLVIVCTSLTLTLDLQASANSVDMVGEESHQSLYLTQDEISMLAMVIHLEGADQSPLGQKAIFSVVVYRIVHPGYWGHDLVSVLNNGTERGKHRCAFSVMCDGKLESIGTDWVYYGETLQLVQVWLEEYNNGTFEEPVPGAHSYYAGDPKTHSYFKDLECSQIEDHWFCRDPDYTLVAQS